MPWAEPPENSSELRHRTGNLVALSALPAEWREYDMHLIAGSIVAALISILDADVAFIALPGDGNQVISGLARATLPNGLKKKLLQRKGSLLGSGQEFVFGEASGRALHVATAPIGFGGDAALAAGCFRDNFPTGTEKLLLQTGANQAAIVFQQGLGDAEKRRFTAIEETHFDRDREVVEAARRVATLSPRERDVFDQLVSGRSNKLIANHLGISVRTVEVHRVRLINRLGVRHLAGAIRVGVLASLKVSRADGKR